MVNFIHFYICRFEIKFRSKYIQFKKLLVFFEKKIIIAQKLQSCFHLISSSFPENTKRSCPFWHLISKKFGAPQHQFFWNISENLIAIRLECKREAFNFEFFARVTIDNFRIKIQTLFTLLLPMKSRILDEKINSFLFWVTKNNEFAHNQNQSEWKMFCSNIKLF